ncbi:AAA family ATPase [uncultured Rothia sp.]|uniref:AAA family ATPase n=1 Tax=uncultured Rothia sp. TaxID=316088 RepID=UPI0025D06FC2|nr:AAA family ATPase [uncultured Rothia sp.]
MKYCIHNMGPVRYAEYSLETFNIICGLNNTGKTYVTYSLFGFLSGWEGIFDPFASHSGFNVKSINLKDLLKTRESKVDLGEYVNPSSGDVSLLQEFLDGLCNVYSRSLDAIFAAEGAKFTDSYLRIHLDESDIQKICESQWVLDVNIPVPSEDGDDWENVAISAEKKEGELCVYFKLKDMASNGLLALSTFSSEKIRRIDDGISFALIRLILKSVFPRPYISSAERTGIVTFREGLMVARQNFVSSIVSKMKNRGDSRNRAMRDSLFSEEISVDPQYDFEYPSAIQSNIDFMTRIKTVIKKDSYIYQNHKNILEYFLNISEGEYRYSSSSIGYFLSKGGVKSKKRNSRFSLDEVSSSVRALVDLWFYLRYYARKGDLLIIDEPELNLHPRNQRLMARLLAMISRAGINILITTHSEYIIRELNYLIRMKSVWEEANANNPDIISEYDESMLIKYDEMNVYVTGPASIFVPKEPAPKRLRRQKVNTLSRVEVSEYGIKMDSFNSVIDDMNRLEDYIYWGVG